MYLADDRLSLAQQPHPQLQPAFLRSERARLIVLEGIDLSGRTTQIQLLHDWLVAQQYRVTTTAWRTSPLISDMLARVRTSTPLYPLTYSMLYCSDHLDRTERVIKPALTRGEIVLADRYTYTAFARDEARGLERAWVRNLYRFTIEPDKVFYLHISPEEAVRRRLTLLQNNIERERLKKKKHRKSKKQKVVESLSSPSGRYASLPLAQETLESFRAFEMKMYSHYQSMQQEFGFHVIEGTQSIDLVQTMLRRAIMQLLPGL